MPVFPKSIARCDEPDYELTLRVLEGELPAGLHGHLLLTANFGAILRSATIRMDLSSTDGVKVRSREYRHPTWYLERALRDTSHRTLQLGPLLSLSPTWGTYCDGHHFEAVLDHLVCTADVEEPWVVDPESLQPVRPLCAPGTWGTEAVPRVAHWPFSARFGPAFSGDWVADTETGELFGGGYSTPQLSGFLESRLGWRSDTASSRQTVWLYRIRRPSARVSPMDQVEAWNLSIKPEQPFEPGLFHFVHLTADHVVLRDFSADATGEGNRSGRSQMLIVRRADLTPGGGIVPARLVVLPQDGSLGSVRLDPTGSRLLVDLDHSASFGFGLDCLLEAGERLVHGGRVDPDYDGFGASPTDQTPFVRYHVDLDSGRVVKDKTLLDPVHMWASVTEENDFGRSFGFDPELLTTRFARQYRDHPQRTVPIEDLPTKAIPGTVFRVDPTSFTIADGFVFPEGLIPTAAAVIPGRGGQPDHLVCPVSFDADSEGTPGRELWIFDASDLGGGPLCRLGHPQFAFGLAGHHHFVAEMPTKTPEPVDLRAYYADAVARQPPEVQEVFEKEIYPRFAGQPVGAR